MILFLGGKYSRILLQIYNMFNINFFITPIWLQVIIVI